MIKAPRMMSFASSSEQQFSSVLQAQSEKEGVALRAMPGKGLARRKTQFMETDALDEEVHVDSKTAPLPQLPNHSLSPTHRGKPQLDLDMCAPSSASSRSLSRSPSHHEAKLCDSVYAATDEARGGGDKIYAKRSGSMTQYDAMYDAIKAMELLEKDVDEDDEGVKESGVVFTEGNGGGGGEGATIVLTSPTPDPAVPSAVKRGSGSKTIDLISNQIKLTSDKVGSGMITMDANTIDLCRQQSTALMGNTVLFPLVLVKQTARWCRFDLACADFKTWKHFTDGSNSHVYKAKCTGSVSEVSHSHTAGVGAAEGAMAEHALKAGMKVIIKALKDSELQNPVALREFDSERELLASISHPHVLTFLGSGVDMCDSLKKLGGGGDDGGGDVKSVRRSNSMKSMLESRAKVFPRPFLVLERLNGGSLALLLSSQMQCGSRVPFLRALQISQQLAQAVDYLHNHFHPDAVLIHRDIKPDNIGFDEHGSLKLMDFGISTCLRRSVLAEGPYLMTGLTGSLRYMAKEVFLERPYNQKVDVHSVGILMWHVATCSMPFPRFSRQQFAEQVRRRGHVLAQLVSLKSQCVHLFMLLSMYLLWCRRCMM